MTPDDPRHGSERGEAQHVRDGEPPCDACYDAKILASRRRTKRKTMGHKFTAPIGDANHERLAALKRKGATWRNLAEWTGMSTSQVWKILDEGPESIIYTRTAARIATMTPARIVTPVGVTRRLRALACLGWSLRAVADEAGVHPDTLVDARDEVRDFMAQRVKDAVADAYERLCMRQPVAAVRQEKAGITRNRNVAIRRGWAPPLAWDDADIDDPAATPQGVKRQPKLNGRPLIRDRHIEDAEWMADADETLTSACARLGIKPDSLYAACKRAGRIDVYDRLADRETNGLERADMRNRKRDAA